MSNRNENGMKIGTICHLFCTFLKLILIYRGVYLKLDTKVTLSIIQGSATLAVLLTVLVMFLFVNINEHIYSINNNL